MDLCESVGAREANHSLQAQGGGCGLVWHRAGQGAQLQGVAGFGLGAIGLAASSRALHHSAGSFIRSLALLRQCDEHWIPTIEIQSM